MDFFTVPTVTFRVLYCFLARQDDLEKNAAKRVLAPDALNRRSEEGGTTPRAHHLILSMCRFR
jgi:hypothetical protein